MKTKNKLHIYLGSEMIAELKIAAKEEGLSVSSLIRMVLTKYLRERN